MADEDTEKKDGTVLEAAPIDKLRERLVAAIQTASPDMLKRIDKTLNGGEVPRSTQSFSKSEDFQTKLRGLRDKVPTWGGKTNA